MTTFVLVHGAWGGAHGFRHVRKILQAEGHEVFTPSLTGIGERVHLTSPLVNLTTHVTDVVNQILFEDLQHIVLVGFSYGGFVVTGALEHVADRINHLVYLDAFVPQSGDTAHGQAWGTGRAKIEIGKAWTVVGPVRTFDDPSEAAWMQARRTPHPIGCFTEAVYLSKPLEDFAFTRTYVKATASAEGEPGNAAFLKAAKHAAASSSWQYFEVATNHMLANNRPAETAKILMDIVGAA